jgi:hypothetical protein
MLNEFSFDEVQARVRFSWALALGIEDCSHFVDRGFQEDDMDSVLASPLENSAS